MTDEWIRDVADATVTYILQSEPGTSLRASGWEIEAENVGGGEKGWNVPSRPREVVSINLFGEEVQHYPLEKKTRYAKVLNR